MTTKSNSKSIDELVKELPQEKQAILEQFREDMKNSPIRKLNKLERDIWGASITRAIEYLPSFRDAIAVLSPYMDASSSTAYTDKYARVGLSYWFFYIADNDTRAIALLHESMHVLNNHFARGANKNIKPRMMNISGDLEINSNLSLLPGAKKILTDFLLPDHENFGFPYHKTLEQYSILIQDKLNEEEEQEDSNSNQENGDGQESSSENSDQSDSSSNDNSESSNDNSESDSADSSSSSDGSDSSAGDESSQEAGGEGSSDDSSDGGSGSEGSPDGGSPGDSNNGQEGGEGDSGSQSGSGYGNAYDSFVEDLLGRKKKGSSNLKDLLSENENGSEKCNGNHSDSGDGQQCDGSCDHSNDSDENGDSSGEGSGDSGKGSLKDSQKNSSSQGKAQRVPTPSRSCDRNTDARSEAADNAEIDRSSITEQNIARRNTRARVVDEINNNKSRGNGSNNEFLKVVSALMSPPKVDWQELFRRKFNAAFNNSVRGRSHLSYKRIDRRSPGKIIFPGRISFQPKAMMGIDTSGSMDKRDYEAVLIEAEGIMKKGLRAKGALQVFSVDTTIKNIEPVKNVKDINLYGGGGTDMSVAFAYVNMLPVKERPNILVLGTDGGTDWNSIIRQLRKSEATYTPIILVTTKYGYESVPSELHEIAAVLDVSEGNNSF